MVARGAATAPAAPGDSAAAADAAELRRRFLSGMSHAASTVSVVTTDGAAGRFGLTVSAMSSVSADGPSPTLLICVHHRSAAAEALLANGVFCVNVLRDDQAHIADTFAGRTGQAAADRFGGTRWTAQATGAPRLIDPLVAFDCRVLRSERVGTHYVVVGEVAEVFIATGGGTPLVYANRAYGTPQRYAPAHAPDSGSEGTLAVGCFQTFAPYVLPGMVAALVKERPGLAIQLLEGDQQYVLGSLRNGEIELALLVDFGLASDITAEALTELPTYVLLPDGHRLSAQAQIALETLVEEPLILLDVVPSSQYFLSLFAARGLQPLVGYRTRSFEMVRGLVGNGLGYSLLGTRPAHDVAYDGHGLLTRPLAGNARPSRVVLAHLAGRPPSAAAQAFIEHCRAFFQAHHF